VPTCSSCGEDNPDRFRLCGFCGAPLATAVATAEGRKTVTIVFTDLKESTVLGERLDPESLHEVIDRYFEEMRRVLVEHGGTIEKFIGDAVMAVFGLPRAHEDDALRAVRAARGMQLALERLNDELERAWGVRLENRTGVNTGEVVAGDLSAGQRVVTGDAVNTAARLEQAAPPMEILLGELTYRLVRDSVEADPVEPLTLKGKAEPVAAYRLREVRLGAAAARGARPLVGRRDELAVLRSALDEAIEANECRLVSLVADAGTGKSRLVDAFAAGVADTAAVHRGRCLPYGKGITFWPLAEVVRDAAGIAEEDDPATAQARLEACAPEDERAATVARVSAALGLSREAFPVEELFWGARRLLASLARQRPRVVVFEDVHWAEPTFLDFVDHLTETVDDAPLLLVCPTRPDLLEHRLDWGVRPRMRRLDLGALSADETELVLANVAGAELPPDVRRRLVALAEGNPLFAEQLLSMLIERGDLRSSDGVWLAERDLAELDVPPTIQALLAARLDHLDEEERVVVQAASVVGLAFARAALEELVPEPVQARLTAVLESLARKHLVRVEGEDGDAFRFDHLLIRDAAYNGLLKRTRATLHERFVAWGDSVNRDRDREVEFEEILAYHLEQAHRYLGELGPLDDHGRELGRRAAERLRRAGGRAFARGDMTAAANLLGRADVLLPPADPERLAFLPDLGEALADVGELDRARALLDEGVAHATAGAGDAVVSGIRLARLLVLFFASGGSSWGEEVERETARALPALEEVGDHAALARAWRLLASVHGRACRFEQESVAGRRAIVHARAAGDRRQELRSAAGLAMSQAYGPAPVDAAIAECERIRDDAQGDRRTVGLALGSLARLYALAGDFSAARTAYRDARRTLEELGPNVSAASLSLDSHAVELLAGDPVAAERELRRDYETLERMGEAYLRSTVAGLLAQALYAEGRFEEASSMCSVTEAQAAEDDAQSQALWRAVRAKLLARRGERELALELAESAIERLRDTDALVWQADALLDLAETRRLLGDEPGAQEAAAAAARLYALKGSEVAAERAKASFPTARGVPSSP
jgi:class 3 adenylate cyclase/tetratricopeptide (TPR) repeat protein